ncbi:hypothetical protein ADL03_43950 [Nocardia sp. NRRL S-836]|nr:hypothetical protein ADL03_43950 [Nocardia sp. NRRL S-836]
MPEATSTTGSERVARRAAARTRSEPKPDGVSTGNGRTAAPWCRSTPATNAPCGASRGVSSNATEPSPRNDGRWPPMTGREVPIMIGQARWTWCGVAPTSRAMSATRSACAGFTCIRMAPAAISSWE